MFRLTREVRFAINDAGGAEDDPQLSRPPSNSYGGYPSLVSYGRFYSLAVTLAGELNPATGYLRNIKDIDDAIRRHVIPAIRADALALNEPRVRALTPFEQPVVALGLLQSVLPQSIVDGVRLSLSPFLSIASLASEHPMVRLSQKFEFSASHRLHSAQMSDEENRKCFGKCNNPNGHGHNYEVQVTLAGQPDEKGLLVDVPAFERVVAQTVIEKFDHKNLNVEVGEFRELMPSVENIAMVIYRLLKPKFSEQRAQLAAVTVWETPKTWCEYSE
ncbi:MAG: 6-pyruvoyltetrahydropterin/6-carboxytetrahydropterin synthase [Phycisphaerales bacterium]|jgi:6-pyruvoyltetrahydropterin/6-carboxytetrahydropterin synthase|nr:6-pyruvoyltetrahydropterin/6-carboxytetrahydropterin synthase [Phycisphaerales bacterium]